jgi:hypothetical protein
MEDGMNTITLLSIALMLPGAMASAAAANAGDCDANKACLETYQQFVKAVCGHEGDVDQDCKDRYGNIGGFEYRLGQVCEYKEGMSEEQQDSFGQRCPHHMDLMADKSAKAEFPTKEKWSSLVLGKEFKGNFPKLEKVQENIFSAWKNGFNRTSVLDASLRGDCYWYKDFRKALRHDSGIGVPDMETGKVSKLSTEDAIYLYLGDSDENFLVGGRDGNGGKYHYLEDLKKIKDYVGSDEETAKRKLYLSNPGAQDLCIPNGKLAPNLKKAGKQAKIDIHNFERGGIDISDERALDARVGSNGSVQNAPYQSSLEWSIGHLGTQIKDESAHLQAQDTRLTGILTSRPTDAAAQAALTEVKKVESQLTLLEGTCNDLKKKPTQKGLEQLQRQFQSVSGDSTKAKTAAAQIPDSQNTQIVVPPNPNKKSLSPEAVKALDDLHHPATMYDDYKTDKEKDVQVNCKDSPKDLWCYSKKNHMLLPNTVFLEKDYMILAGEESAIDKPEDKDLVKAALKELTRRVQAKCNGPENFPWDSIRDFLKRDDMKQWKDCKYVPNGAGKAPKSLPAETVAKMSLEQVYNAVKGRMAGEGVILPDFGTVQSTVKSYEQDMRDFVAGKLSPDKINELKGKLQALVQNGPTGALSATCAAIINVIPDAQKKAAGVACAAAGDNLQSFEGQLARLLSFQPLVPDGEPDDFQRSAFNAGVSSVVELKYKTTVALSWKSWGYSNPVNVGFLHPLNGTVGWDSGNNFYVLNPGMVFDYKKRGDDKLHRYIALKTIKVVRDGGALDPDPNSDGAAIHLSDPQSPVLVTFSDGYEWKSLDNKFIVKVRKYSNGDFILTVKDPDKATAGIGKLQYNDNEFFIPQNLQFKFGWSQTCYTAIGARDTSDGRSDTNASKGILLSTGVSSRDNNGKETYSFEKDMLDTKLFTPGCAP